MRNPPPGPGRHRSTHDCGSYEVLRFALKFYLHVARSD